MDFSASRDRASELDRDDPLAWTRSEFIIPSKAEIASSQLDHKPSIPESDKSVYLCGNSLGLQPKRTRERIQQYLDTWAKQGVQGHFKPLEDSNLPTWLDTDARSAKLSAPIVGADESEVAVMQTLTANLHILMSAFYQPNIKGRHKIILESKAFPSDHFVVETQIRHHGLSAETSMVLVKSPNSEDNILTTEDIMAVISEHASTTAVLLLPGIQYYTGQLLDIKTITAFAHKHGIFVIWDLAHAAGNVPLSLHDWDVDAAAWCTYKYLNSGPGCIGGLFVHERHSVVTKEVGDDKSEEGYKPRLAGWWGNDKKTRFVMANKFHPVQGAAGFQLSNPSVMDMTSVNASLEIFEKAGGVPALRKKSLRLTAFLEELFKSMSAEDKELFRIITPSDPEQRGAQLSIMLSKGILDTVMKELELRGVIVDERKPDVIRVAPAPLYNNFSDCAAFVEAFSAALGVSRKAQS